MENAKTIEEWMVDPAIHLPVFEHQDGEWCIASAFPVPKLIDLYNLPNTVAARRDSILYAIAINLEMLLGPDPNGREEVEPYRERILEFAIDAWNDILRIDREMGLSGDFETHVLPYMETFLRR
jgi:hypothetical protein